MLDLEVMSGSAKGNEEKFHPALARCSIPLAEILTQLETEKELKPMAQKLYSPLGQGPERGPVDRRIWKSGRQVESQDPVCQGDAH